MKKQLLIYLLILIVGVGLLGAGIYSTIKPPEVQFIQSAPPTPKPKPKWEGNIEANKDWTTIPFRAKVNETFRIEVEGKIFWAEDAAQGESWVGPSGTSYHASRMVEHPEQFPFQEGGCGALLMRLNSKIYFVGSSMSFASKENGKIEFRVGVHPLSETKS